MANEAKRSLAAIGSEPNEDDQKHTISLYVSNKPGVLIRIALVFARRGYNIDSLVVSPGTDPDFSTMNIVARGSREVLDQILKQLNKLVDVVHATDRTGESVIQRELALIKVQCEPVQRTEVLQLAQALQCRSLDVGDTTVILQFAGTSEELDGVSRILASFGSVELVRTGKILITRGPEPTA